MKKEELRKVQVSLWSDTEFKFNTFIGYFHIWGRIEQEVQTPYTDDFFGLKKEIVTKGIVEDKNIGQVYTVSPDSITFLND